VKIVKVIKGSLSDKQLQQVINVFKEGGIAVIPTDTVYGVFCSAENKKAVKKIYDLKGRDFSKPLQVFVSSLKQMRELAGIGNSQKRFLKEKLPGPYTLIFKAKPEGVKKMDFIDKTIGIRLVELDIINTIINGLNGPLAATSANFSGAATPDKFRDIDKEFLKNVDICIQFDKIVRGKASTVIDMTDGKKIIRH
jgi:L-threonylcarbamoyladenylate synthase